MATELVVLAEWRETLISVKYGELVCKVYSVVKCTFQDFTLMLAHVNTDINNNNIV